MTNVYFLSIK